MIVLIKVKHKGDFKEIDKFFRRNGKGLLRNKQFMSGIEAIAQKGVDALREATPKRTGKTSESWSYEIKIDEKNRENFEIVWNNSNQVNGANIAMLIQYGHSTKSGYYVEGRDYINPALKPIFDEIAEQVWAEVTGNAYY